MSYEDSAEATLRWFVYRARRVADHSLALDRGRLLRWASVPMNVELRDGKTWVSFDLPPEEATESLAARCRPFIIKQDDAHYAKAINALRFFTKKDSALLAKVVKLSKVWARYDRANSKSFAYESRVGSVSGDGFTELQLDLDLAYRWLYGDLVHGDNVSDMGHGLDERYRAGAYLTCNLAVLAVSTLNLTLMVQERGLLRIPKALLEQPVAAQTSRKHECLAIMAPADLPSEQAANLMELMRQHVEQQRAGLG